MTIDRPTPRRRRDASDRPVRQTISGAQPTPDQDTGGTVSDLHTPTNPPRPAPQPEPVQAARAEQATGSPATEQNAAPAPSHGTTSAGSPAGAQAGHAVEAYIVEPRAGHGDTGRRRKGKTKVKITKPKMARTKKPKKSRKAKSSETTPEALNQVPAPGGRYRGGRGTHVTIKTVATITGAVLALGATAGVTAWGVKALQAPPLLEITGAEQAKYGLDAFPVTGAAAFAQRYVDLCLANVEDEREQARTTQIKALSTAGISPDCGISTSAPDVEVLATAFTGVLGQVPGRESTRFIGVQASLSDGRLLDLSVPVWTDPADPGVTFMVVGPLGNNPLPLVADVPSVDDFSSDSVTAGEIQETVLNEFFTAWGDSNTTVLERFAADDATPAVTSGLAGSLGTPMVDMVTVMLPTGESGKEWEDGEVADTQATVTWTLPGADGGYTFSYLLAVVKTANGWSVQDISGGGVDLSGSNASSDVAAVPGAPTAPAEDGETEDATSTATSDTDLGDDLGDVDTTPTAGDDATSD